MLWCVLSIACRLDSLTGGPSTDSASTNNLQNPDKSD